ncbi:hypothetical protein D3Z62_27650, partial [Lachnospiraceae bacterium]|nr:hypothetical protein [Lachnospiraceae bacterium]
KAYASKKRMPFLYQNLKTNKNYLHPTAKKYLRHFRNCGILNIKKDICANRCPTGATDRRLARLFSHKIAVTFGRVGGYFCVLTSSAHHAAKLKIEATLKGIYQIM